MMKLSDLKRATDPIRDEVAARLESEGIEKSDFADLAGNKLHRLFLKDALQYHDALLETLVSPSSEKDADVARGKILMARWILAWVEDAKMAIDTEGEQK